MFLQEGLVSLVVCELALPCWKTVLVLLEEQHGERHQNLIDVMLHCDAISMPCTNALKNHMPQNLIETTGAPYHGT